jgi:hypothetical protein
MTAAACIVVILACLVGIVHSVRRDMTRRIGR